MLLNRVRCGMAALLVVIAGGVAAYGQDHEAQGLAAFEPADITPYGGNWAQPKEGLFFTFDGLFWTISRPRRTSIGDPTNTPFVFDQGAGQTIEQNSLETELIKPYWKLGDRMEFGNVDGHHGIMFTTLQTNSQTTVFEADDATVVFNDPRINGSAQGLLDIVFPNGGLGEARTKFTTLNVIAKSRISGVEALYLYRTGLLQHGGTAEVLLGGRYFQLKDQFWVDGEGGNLADSFWNTTSKNQITGPEIGLRMFQPFGRFGFSVDSRFTAGINAQSVRQDGRLANTLLGNNAFPLPTLMYSNGFNHSANMTQFSPIVELRAEFHMQITNLIAAKAGWTGMWVNNVVRAADMIDYTVPSMGITAANGGNLQDVFINGLTLSVEFNR